jgi:histidinol-phosphate phosphatase family protein
VPDAERFGRVVCGEDSVVTSFEEKGSAGPGWINAGIYFFASNLARTQPRDRPFSLEREFLPTLVGTALLGWRTSDRFIDIGTSDSYAAAQTFFARGSGEEERVGLLLLDRDGTMIVEKHYLSTPQEVELLDGVAEGLLAFQRRGYDLAIVTNQSGIGRGFYREKDFDAVNSRLIDLLEEAGVRISGIWHCPHTPGDNCACRKPATGMFESATRELGYQAHECIVVGDKVSDVELGRNAGARTVLVRTGYGCETEVRGNCTPDMIVDGIRELAQLEVTP